jgi:hypothetical protein
MAEGGKDGVRDKADVLTRLTSARYRSVAEARDAPGRLRSMPPRPVAPRDWGDQIRKEG